MTRDRLARCWILVSVATAGAIVMAVELLGARVLSVVFGGSLTVWAGMISVTLMSLALGYFLGGCLSDRFPRSRALYGILLAACALTALCPYAKSALLTCSSAFGLQWGPVAGSATIFAPPLVLFGTVGPFAIRLLGTDAKRIGTVAGSVYAVSTLGSVAGTLLAGLWLVPRFGVLVSFGTVAAFGATVACVGLTCAVGWRGIACFVVPMALMCLHISPRVGFTCRAPDGEPIVVRDLIESPYGRVTVLSKGNYRLLLVNGVVQTGMPEGMNETAKGGMLLHRYHQELIPYLLEEPAGASVLLIGSGGGMTATLLKRHGMRVDCVDLDGRVVDTARKWFGFSGNAVVADGRVYLETCDRRYDACVLDVYSGDTFPTHLASVEAFRLVRGVLRRDGVLAVNFIGSPRGKAFAAVCRTVREVFPEIMAVRSEENGEVQTLTLFASIRKLELNNGWIDDVGVNQGADRVGQDLVRLRIEPELDRAMILTDDHNPLDRLRADEALRWRQRTLRTIGPAALF